VPISRNELKSVTALVKRKGRAADRLFLAEGIRLLEEAVRFDFLPQTVYYAPSMCSPRAESLLDTMKERGISLCRIQKQQLLAMSDTKTPQGVVGLFKRPETGLGKLYRPGYRNILWCENISDPGNLGTLIRSALAFGFGLVVTSGRSADAYAPKVVRSSAGAIFGLWVAIVETDKMLKFASEKELRLIATELGGEILDEKARCALGDQAIILAVGSEGDGLSPDILSKADRRVRIDHSDSVQSLNAAVAGSMIMGSLYRREG